MNIVKIKNYKDVYGDNINYNYRDMYCYVIQMKYLVPIKKDKDDVNTPGILTEDYIELERMIGENEFIDYANENHIAYHELHEQDDIENVIDKNQSPMIHMDALYYYTENDKTKILNDNKGLKLYRAKVANFILNMTKKKDEQEGEPAPLDLCPKRIKMLEYYGKYDMKDETSVILEILQPDMVNTTSVCETSVLLNPTPTCSCGQQNLSTISLGLNTGVSCNLLRGYRKEMKKLMTETFTDIDFWKKVVSASSVYQASAIALIYKYTDALIESGLSIFGRGDKKLDLNTPCVCAGNRINLFDNYQNDLKDILKAFGYMKEGIHSIDANISFITVAMRKFATYYEYLQWTGFVIDTDENWE